MQASEMIKTITDIEVNYYNRTELKKDRILFFQYQNLPMEETIEEDEEYSRTKKHIEEILETSITDETFKKILNNWYIWAKNNIKISQNIIFSAKFSDPIEWLIANNFCIDYEIFEEGAKQETIEEFKNIIPEDSEKYLKLKEMAEKEYPDKKFTYEELLKVISGFAENFSTKLQ